MIGVILCSGIVYVSGYLASDISYTPTDASWEVSNVEDALDSLYNSVNNELSTTKTLKYENVLDEFTIRPSNGNASGSNIEPVNIGEDNFYNLTGSVNYA